MFKTFFYFTKKYNFVFFSKINLKFYERNLVLANRIACYVLVPPTTEVAVCLSAWNRSCDSFFSRIVTYLSETALGAKTNVGWDLIVLMGNWLDVVVDFMWVTWLSCPHTCHQRRDVFFNNNNTELDSKKLFRACQIKNMLVIFV